MSGVPAKSTLLRLNATPAEKLEREQRLAGAVRTILECLGEDPDREGLQKTPERYAKALMWMTRGYEERLKGNHRPLINLLFAFDPEDRTCGFGVKSKLNGLSIPPLPLVNSDKRK